jgi:hypothetical protein
MDEKEREMSLSELLRQLRDTRPNCAARRPLEA